MKYKAVLLLFVALFWLSFIPVANADMCRDRFDGRVCILKLKRSAKNYWEYRAKVSIDGKKQANIEIYNCRDRTLTRKGKYPIPFQENSPGELVCKTFQRRSNSYIPSKW